MVNQIEKKPEESWLIYLVRRLGSEGVDMGKFRAKVASYKEFVESNLERYSRGVLLQLGRRWDTTKPLPKKSYSVSDFSKLPEDSKVHVDEQVLVQAQYPNALFYICFHFDEREDMADVKINSHSDIIQRGIFAHFAESYTVPDGQKYKAKQLIDYIMDYVMNPECCSFEYIGGGVADRLDEVVRAITRLEAIVAKPPIVVRSDEAYLKELYVKTIMEDASNLRSFEYNGRRFSYALVNSYDLDGHIGRNYANLNFVARDLVPEEWQQIIVGWHEYTEPIVGHDEARRKELPLARFLGKEREFLKWRRKIKTRVR